MQEQSDSQRASLQENCRYTVISDDESNMKFQPLEEDEMDHSEDATTHYSLYLPPVQRYSLSRGFGTWLASQQRDVHLLLIYQKLQSKQCL
ncbi:hypothetical protein scyTo_0002521 [Scyliorhinus torazame]|uniref:Uncharacterized protein n=1 Tax=Scyliorhinus torazame TaxID=75743 RepID=A0A401PJX1_SCYTO|nr:hypothetical protein [Scyliorhinus torazame]